MTPKRSSSLVYSTDSGRICPGCGQPVAACQCGQATAPPSGDGVLRISREKAGRGGKTVTAVRGALLDAAGLAALAKRLKAASGSGGTVKDGVIEIQGDHADRLLAWLVQDGFKVKRAGG
jgi:translation initiation factor 1